MSEIVKRLREYAEDDHERGCQGRYYTCSCGYDDKRDPLLQEAAARIETFETELEKTNSQYAQDAVELDMAHDTIKNRNARIERLEAALRKFSCGCPGSCERSEEDRDDACEAHNALEGK